MSDNATPVNFQTSTQGVVDAQRLVEATNLIEYRSAGHTLVIGELNAALEVATQLQDAGATVIALDATLGVVEKNLTADGVTVFSCAELGLAGHLGAFKAMGNPSSENRDLAVSVYRESGAFDSVIDLSESPMIDVLLPPFGYFHATTPESLQQAIDDVKELVGTFDKPKYFDYNVSVCAHSRSEITACTACIDACSTGAIRSDGEGISVDPFLCQGCGSCSTTCPTGAISYAYPKPADAIEKSRELMAGRPIDTLLLHTESAQAAVDAHHFNEFTLPLVVEEVSAFGLDYWSAMLCSGVQRILLVTDSDAEDPNRRVLSTQAKLFHRMLSGLRVDTLVVQLLDLAAALELVDVPVPPSALTELTQEHFAAQSDKRQNIRMAFDSLATQLPPVDASQPLTADAPFGRIKVNQSACTLCMACVSVCPGKALLDGQDTPALRMVEANCVQCGLCEQACPESAIELEPRFLYDGIASRKIETLKEETPFHCVSCHKPFATNQMISRMMAKLVGHWMFGDDRAKRRLKMCEDCRVKDIFEDSQTGIDVHKSSESRES